jgi:copper resistance protein D
VTFLHYVVIFIHLIAAISWIGGMLFLSLVLAPLVRPRNTPPEFMALFRTAARRFRLVVWSAIALLLGTGPILLHQRGLSFAHPGQWPDVLRIKIGLVAIFILLTVAHDLLIGTYRRITALPGRTTMEHILLRTSAWLPRVALLVALAIVVAAVMLTRS